MPLSVVRAVPAEAQEAVAEALSELGINPFDDPFELRFQANRALGADPSVLRYVVKDLNDCASELLRLSGSDGIHGAVRWAVEELRRNDPERHARHRVDPTKRRPLSGGGIESNRKRH